MLDGSDVIYTKQIWPESKSGTETDEVKQFKCVFFLSMIEAIKGK